ncbi:MAG TPA: hypothetical protein DEB06_11680, partial [Phycisphaerales bacterium]|nr:hypothetical protein [Phycisphaerales bacterium]
PAPHRRGGGEALAGGLLLAVGVGGAWLGALFAPSPPTGGRVGALALGAIAPFAPGMTRSAHGAARVAWCGVTALCLLPLDPRLSVVAVLALVGAAIGAAAPKRLRRGALDLLWTLAVPALAALVALRVDLRALDPSSWAVWFSLAPALVWCSDGRMLASWLALRASGAPMPWTGAARMVNAGALAPHLVFTGAGFASGLLSNTTLTACVASALLLSITPGARRLFARLIEPPRG